jgi:putative methylase
MDKILLSKSLSGLEEPISKKIYLEQYSTNIKTAVNFLFFVDTYKRIKGKRVTDFGCGNGILGIGAALLGAAAVDMYDLDQKMVELAKKNVSELNITDCNAYEKDFFDVDVHYDIAISNPPFGFQSTFNIEAFISKLKKTADSFFFIYKANKKIQKIVQAEGLTIKDFENIALPKSAIFHKKDSVNVPICIVYKA